MDIESHIQYWMRGSEEDLAAAESLLQKGHVRHALFFAHLAIEKALKAHVTRATTDVPPRIHNLVRLADMTRLTLSADQLEILRGFGVYQLQGRYPDADQIEIAPEFAKAEVAKARGIVEWLTRQL